MTIIIPDWVIYLLQVVGAMSVLALAIVGLIVLYILWSLKVNGK